MLPPKRRDTYMKNLTKALKEMPERKGIQRAMTEEPAVTSLRD